VLVIPWAILMAILGLVLLLMPKSWMLGGLRWRLKDGEDAEPSDAYVLYTRVIAVLFIVVAVAVTIWTLWAEADQARRVQLEELWDVSLNRGDDIVLTIDPEVVQLDGPPYEFADREVSFDPSRVAIVGRDELGDLGDTSALQDGDLLVGLGYSACTFSHLVVKEDADSVEVVIVVLLPDVQLPPGILGPDTDESSPFDALNDYTLCTRRFSPEPDDVGLRVIRVPLEQPLGDREVN